MKKFIVATFFALMVLVLFTLSVASAVILQLTNNDYDDTVPQIHNGQVVWQSGDWNNTPMSEIFYWDGTNVQQLTISPYKGQDSPRIRNGHVVWSVRGETLVYWDGTSLKCIGHCDGNYEGHPQINNGQVVWWRSLFDYSIYHWDGTNFQKISNDIVLDFPSGPKPQIHNGQVV